MAHCSPSFVTSSTNDVTSWSLALAATCTACAPLSTRRHSCSMTTPCCTSAGTAVCWRPDRCGGKVSLIAELCKPSPRGTRSCFKEQDDVPLSTTRRLALGSASTPTLQLVARRCSSGRPRWRSWRRNVFELGLGKSKRSSAGVPRGSSSRRCGGHPDPVAGSWLHGARSRDETASRCPNSVQFPWPRGEGLREKTKRAAVCLQSHMRVRFVHLLVQRRQCAATLNGQEVAARVQQQRWCVTHPPPVASWTIGFREHAAALDVSSGPAR